MAVKAGTAYIEVKGDFSSLDKSIASQSKRTKSNFAKIGKAAAIGLGAGLAGAAVLTKKSVDAAVDLGEQINKTRVVFKGSEKDILRWSKTTASGIGTSRREALEAAGTFGNMLVPMGLARDRAADMSQRMVTLAADMASFNNASPAETLDAIRAGLAGETEPLRRYGIFLNEARINQQAMKMGLIETGEELTAKQKALATYGIILKDTADTQGDFGRTSESLANQQRILRAQVENLGARLGKSLIPPLTDAATFTSKFVRQMQTGKGAGGDFADVMSNIGQMAPRTLLMPRLRCLKVIGAVRGEHPAMVKAAGGIGGTRAGAEGHGQARRRPRRDGHLGAVQGAVRARGRLCGGRLSSFVAEYRRSPRFRAVRHRPARFVKEVTRQAPRAARRFRRVPVTGAGRLRADCRLVAGHRCRCGDRRTSPRRCQPQPPDRGRGTDPQGGGGQAGARRPHQGVRAPGRPGYPARPRVRAVKEKSRGLTEQIRKNAERLRGFGGASDKARESIIRTRQRTDDLREAARGFGGAADRAAGRARQLGGNVQRAGGKPKTVARKVKGLRGEVDDLKSKKIDVEVDVGVSIAGVKLPNQGDLFGGDGWGIEGRVTQHIKDNVQGAAKKNPMAFLSGAFSGGPVAGVDLKGANSNLGIFAALGSRFGLGVASGFRPGSITSSGNLSHHATGRALDISGSAAGMLAFARLLAAAFGSRLAELIHTPMGFSIKNGAKVAPYAQKDHYDHVHVAMQKGGTAPMGRKVPGQGSGDKVPVAAMLEPGERFAVMNRNAAKMWEAINGAFPRFARGGIMTAARAAYRAGFRGQHLINMLAIAGRESTYNPRAANYAYPDHSIGLWQINQLAHKGRYGSDAELMNPVTNAKAAKALFDASGYAPWVGVHYGNAASYLDDARAAVARLGSGSGSGGGGGGGGGSSDPWDWTMQGDERRNIFVKGRQKPLSVDTERFVRLGRAGKIDWKRTKPSKPGDASARKAKQRHKNFHNRPDTIFGGFAEGFSKDFAMREALAALTPGTEDDLAIQKQAANTWATLLMNAQKAGAGKDVITTLAQNLKAAQDAITQLTGAVDEERASRDAHTEALKEHSKLVKETQDLARTQGPGLASALAMFSAGYTGNRAALGRGYPSFAGAGGVART